MKYLWKILEKCQKQTAKKASEIEPVNRFTVWKPYYIDTLTLVYLINVLGGHTAHLFSPLNGNAENEFSPLSAENEFSALSAKNVFSTLVGLISVLERLLGPH